jgi:hypothetical protein
MGSSSRVPFITLLVMLKTLRLHAAPGLDLDHCAARVAPRGRPRSPGPAPAALPALAPAAGLG